MSGETYMAPVAGDQSSKQAELLAMRSIADTMARLATAVDKIGDKVDDVRDRVARLEERTVQVGRIERQMDEQRVESANARLAIRIDLQAVTERLVLLEAQRNRQDGANGVWGWVAKATPWAIPLGGAIAATFGLHAIDRSH